MEVVEPGLFSPPGGSSAWAAGGVVWPWPTSAGGEFAFPFIFLNNLETWNLKIRIFQKR